MTTLVAGAQPGGDPGPHLGALRAVPVGQDCARHLRGHLLPGTAVAIQLVQFSTKRFSSSVTPQFGSKCNFLGKGSK